MALRRGPFAAVLLLAALVSQAAAQSTIVKSIEFSSVAPGDVFEASSSAGAVPGFSVTAKYNRDGTPVDVTCTPEPTSQFSLGTTRVTCSGGLDVNVTVDGVTKLEFIGGIKRFNISVVDRSKPDVTVPENIVVEASGPITNVPITVTSTDKNNVDESPAITCTTSRGDTLTGNGNLTTVISNLPVSPRTPAGTPIPVSITCKATDKSGNTSPEKTFTITVVDTKKPVITANTTVIIVEAEDDTGTVVNVLQAAQVVANDNVDGPLTPVGSGIPPNDRYPLGNTTVTFTATDASGNSDTVTVTVIVRDTIAPVIAQPADIRLNATDDKGRIVDFNIPTATDAVTKNPLVTCNATSGTVFPITQPPTTTTVRCDSKDAAGNAAEPVFFTITVVDEIKPEMPANSITIYLQDDSGKTPFPGFPNKFASDQVDGPNSVPLVCDIQTGTQLSVGVVAAKCTATDKAGNTAEAEYTITVMEPVTQLTITVPQNQTLEAVDTAGAQLTFTVQAADSIVGSVSNPRPITIACSTVGSQSPGSVALTANSAASTATATVASSTYTNTQFNIQVNTITCTATNFLGKTATKTFTVTVRDTTAPTITVTNPTSAEKTDTTPGPAEAQPGGTPITYTVVVNDDVDKNLTVGCTPIVSGGLFPVGNTTVSCTVTDFSGNSATDTTVVYVADSTPPTIDTLQPIRDTTTDPSGKVITYNTPVCRDDFDGILPVTCTPASGSNFPLGNTTYSCSCTDKAGNTATTTSTITITDICVPTISGPANVTREATSPTGVPSVTFNVTAQNCIAGSLPVTCTPASGSPFPYDIDSKGSTRTDVTCTATYDEDSKPSVTFPVFIVDTTPPTIGALPNIAAQAGASEQVAVNYTVPDADDIVDGKVPLVCVPASGTTFSVGNTTVTCTATDKAGNTASKTFTVTVSLAPVPEITCPKDIVQEATVQNGQFFANVSYSLSSTEDVACFIGSTQISSPVQVFLKPDFTPNTVKVTCRVVSDPRATCDFSITVQDKTKCVLTEKNDIRFVATASFGVEVSEASVGFTQGSDNLSPKEIKAPCTWTGKSCANGKCRLPLGTTTVTCSATDSAGNACSTSFKVVVKDNVPPCIIVCPITIDAQSAAGTRITSLRERVTDNVDGVLTPPAVTYRLASNNQTITLPYTFPLGTTRVIIRAVDSSGNVAERATYVRVVDRVCPIVRAKDPIVVRTAADKSGVTITSFAGLCTATDNITPADRLVIRYKPVGVKFPVGKTWITCTATDAAGNTGVSGFWLKVEAPRDTCYSIQSHISQKAPFPWMVSHVHQMCGYVEKHDKVRACSMCTRVRSSFTFGSYGKTQSDKLWSQLGCGRPFKKF